MTKIIPKMKQLITEERGAVAIIVAISMLVLIGFAAFAIDFGYVYAVKNELQNASDAAALAGASVLFEDNERCVSPGLPFACCTGDKTGVCVVGNIDVNTVEETAKELAALNKSGGSIPNVQIGHYAFADTWGGDGSVFTHVPSAVKQIDGWQTSSFKVLNENTNFINAVHVTLTRNNIPRFFSRIWSKSDNLGVSVQSTAYLGFTGSLMPGEVDLPVAICKQKITNNSLYTCDVGRMMNQNTQNSYWTDFNQEGKCGTASNDNVGDYTEECLPNDKPIIFGEGMDTTNGTGPNTLKDTIACWKKAEYDYDLDGDLDPIDSNGDNIPDKPWKVTLPVVDCPGADNDNCRTVVGAVVVDIVWITDPGANEKPTDKTLTEDYTGMPSTMSNPLGNDWNRNAHDECTAGKVGASDLACWNKFVDEFNLEGGAATWEPNTLYFLPDCKEHTPKGTIGGANYGLQAVHPVLVKESKEKL